ncbi:MAG: substrate-binding domain-containing protein [Opitutaceae bacterium]
MPRTTPSDPSPKNRKTQRARLLRVLETEIIGGKYPPEEPMPSEHELCARFKVSRTTVRHALGDLAHKGHIYKQHGRGTFAHRVQPRPIKPIGLLIREPQKLSNPYFVDLIRGANSYLMSIGSYVSVIHQSPQEWTSHLIGSIGGVIVIPTPLKQEDIDALERWRLPYVICTDAVLKGPTISYDFRSAALHLTEGLLGLGHRKFGIISGHMQHGDLLKKDGIREALTKAGIDFDAVPDYMTNFDEKIGRQAANALFARHPEITAIIATDDILALIAMQVAQQRGRRVPFDLSVVGFNDLAVSALFEPALTSVHFPVVEAGRKAAEMLCLHIMKGEPIVSKPMGHEIIWRQSTAPITPVTPA